MSDGRISAAAIGRPPWMRVAAALGFWLTFVLLATTYAVANGYRYQLKNLPLDAALVTLGTLYGLVLQGLLRRATGGSFARQVTVAILLVAAAAPLFEASFELSQYLLGSATSPPTLARVLRLSLFWLAPLGLWAAINLALFHDREARARELRIAEFRKQAQDAQLRALRYQVNPHFLYNTLNSIAALILDNRNQAAEAMVLRLSDFFRASLANDPHGDVTLADEVALQRVYLDIEQIRFGENFRVEIAVAEEVANARVPSLILQPIVENAVKHGLNEAGTDTLLRLSAWRDGERLLVEVADNGPGRSSQSGTGVGLDNVRRRLEARFGGSARVETVAATGAGFVVRLDMPWQAP